MSGLVYYVCDSETNGLSSSVHEMTEIGIIRCTDRVQIWRQIKCEHPERSSYDALRITKKTLADLALGYDKEQIVEECNKFFEEDGASPAHRVIIGHNIAFDRKFLHSLWEKCGKEFPASLWLDTIALTRQYAKQIGLIKPKVNLHAACDIVGIKKFSDAHNAKVDSRNTYLLHKNLVEDKHIDYLPFIKTAIHSLSKTNNDDEIDLSILED